MGIVNATPDSFSDGGAGRDELIDRGHALLAAGADILDIGGESTRPGATPISWEEEWARIGELVTEFSRHATVSVDTYHHETAARALEAGASIINDVSMGADPAMADVVIPSSCDYILQHSWTVPALTHRSEGVELSSAIVTEWSAAAARLLERGMDPSRIIFDPGLGFGKAGEENWEAIRNFAQFAGFRVLIGASRKRFLAEEFGRDLADLDLATAALSATLMTRGVWAVRVHNVRATVIARAVASHL